MLDIDVKFPLLRLLLFLFDLKSTIFAYENWAIVLCCSKQHILFDKKAYNLNNLKSLKAEYFMQLKRKFIAVLNLNI